MKRFMDVHDNWAAVASRKKGVKDTGFDECSMSPENYFNKGV